ncbi:alpha-1D adrenergic receptor [Exaiptasia diaphana]|uniref:G-protein coupled receptors family 1 profile domain-containing protein n=1 Tax=Exaiptasia diaphana TaxID=2652724 RepID=A0A913Y9L7_EXADI|nr:alpha-1D adrenergic receptor [Exaiptasia diaphana]
MSMLSLGPFTGWEHISFNPTTAHCGISFPVSLAEKLRLTVLAALAFVFPLAFMAYAYCRIYWKINEHEKRLSGTIRRNNSMKRKLSLTLCMMFGTFVACWSPFFLLIVLAIILKDPGNLPEALGRIAYWFGYINCCLNPVFYCIRASTFRELMRERSVTMSHNVNFAVPNRGKRAFSLPTLPTKRRNSSSVGSAAISPTPILVGNIADSTQHKRIPSRMRAFSWTADFRLPGMLTTPIAQSSNEITLSRPKEKKNVVKKARLIMTNPETISESPVEMDQMEEIVLNVTPRRDR